MWQRALRRIFIDLACTLLILLCSVVYVFAERSGSTGNIAILQIEDPVPRGAEKITQRFFTGNGKAGGCSYYELLLAAEESAYAVGADVLKIVSRSSHSRSQRCDGVEVAFYRSGNPRSAEQSFRWNTDHRLTWDDFRGSIRRGADRNIAAETSCGIAIETSLVANNEVAKVYVFNVFDKQQSWVREGYDRDDVLQHEQGHWDICEIYTRKMQARFDAARITGANLKQQVARIYDEVSNEYLARQEQYEAETEHGIIDSEQNRWTEMLQNELNLSSSSLSKL